MKAALIYLEDNLSYEKAIEYLQNLTTFGINLGLGRITELLHRLGDPHRQIKVVHVGGTNGKGSVCAMLVNVLQQAGYRTGSFTSPHLHSYTERFQINGQPIGERALALLISRLRPHLAAMEAEGFEHPTEFEVSTALAFCYFVSAKVDLVVLEVGLGGAIDSTNVVTPLVSVITNVAMDHIDYLGHTVEEIAQVKTGIIKPGIPTVSGIGYRDNTDTQCHEGVPDEGALAVLEEVCRQKESSLVLVGRDINVVYGNYSIKGQYFDYQGLKWQMKDLCLSLLGRHQVVNAALALATLEILGVQGYPVLEEALRYGLKHVIWPARLELLGDSPQFLLDGAHNYAGACSLSRALTDYFPEQKKVFVLGMLGDKERLKVIAQLAPLAHEIIITKPNHPRAGDWRQLAVMAKRYVDQVAVIENLPLALESSVTKAGLGCLVCITGSLYMVAEAREWVLKRQ